MNRIPEHENEAGELQRLRESHRQISDLLKMIQDLTGRVIQTETHDRLFDDAFRTLFGCLRFDIGTAVLVEQMLELYMLYRENLRQKVGDSLIEDLRQQLQYVLPDMFSSTEFRVRVDAADLPAREGADGPLHSVHAMLELRGRTLGLIVLYRLGEPFTEADEQILKIFSTQIALLIGNLRDRDEIRSMADTDDLTGVANRRALKHMLEREIDRSRVYDLPLSLVMVDIDDFKVINDSFGHGVGDYVLSELCGALRDSVRQPDLVARYGGDEFIVVLPHTDILGARHVSERIVRKAREVTVDMDEVQVRCSISVGVVEFDTHADIDAGQLIRRADSKLYEAKRSGKNQFVS